MRFEQFPAHDAITPLPVCEPLQPGESVTSFVQRHCEANAVPKMSHMLQLISAHSDQPVASVRNLELSAPALRVLESLTHLEPMALEPRRMVQLEGATASIVRQGVYEWPKPRRFGVAQALCPECLRTDGYARATWEFTQAPVCTHHRAALIEHCPECAKRLRPNRATLLHCETCGFDLANAPAQRVSEAAVRAAQMIQSPAMIALGDEHSTAPIDPNDLSMLLDLCVLRPLGASRRFGLNPALGEATVSDRIAALERMGSCIVGARIDSGKLREAMSERWPYLLTAPDCMKLDRLSSLAPDSEIEREVWSMVLSGDWRTALKVVALSRFDGHPPQLTSTEDLARFLGIDLPALNELLRLSPAAPPTSTELGYAAEDIANLQDLIASLLQVDDVDRFLGIPGLTRELVALHKLQLISSSGHELGIAPSAVCSLMDQLADKVSCSSAQAESVPFSAIFTAGNDASAIAWAVAQVIGGGLVATGWQNPYRLCDLLVDRTQLKNTLSLPVFRRQHH